MEITLASKINETELYLRNHADIVAKDALILGSGLGAFADTLDQPTVIPYAQIPHWPTSAVKGHAGNLVFGEYNGIPVIVMQGRAHVYEGWPPEIATFPIRVFKALGVERVLITNSAGGINANFQAGDLMVIDDHLNLTGCNPLVGKNDDTLGPRFPDMSNAYNKALRNAIARAARSLNLSIKSGVYAGLLGPTYETPAEVRMLQTLGADAVGMSTVLEVIVANHAGIQVAGISCISNMAAGISPSKLNHDEVRETADRVSATFISLVKAYLTEVAL